MDGRGKPLLHSLFLAALLLGGCNLNPPHFVGDESRRQGSAPDRPAWVDWTLREEGEWIYFTGLASRHRDKGEARRTAEADARNRLAATLESRIISDLERGIQTTGTARGGRVVAAQEKQEIRSRLQALVDVAVRGTKPVQEYYEEYDLFNRGWERHYDFWVLLRIPRRDYESRLAEIRRRDR